MNFVILPDSGSAVVLWALGWSYVIWKERDMRVSGPCADRSTGQIASETEP